MRKISNKKIKPISPSIIQKEIHIVGNVTGEGGLEVSGRVDGDVKCLSLVLREGGIIVGDVTAEKVEIHGEITGDIKARTIICSTSAKVVGDIVHQSIQIEDGAFVDGNCKKHISADEVVKLPEVKLKLIEEKKSA